LAIAPLIAMRRVQRIGTSTTLPTSAKQIEREVDGDGCLDILPLLDDVVEPVDAEAKECG